MRIVAVSLAALLALTACAKRTPPTEIGPAPSAETGPTTEESSDIDIVELPAMQADLVARAGSDTIYFATDKSYLDDASRETLAAQAQWLLANPNVRASIEGHADERGTREYNLALGERRASAARDVLIAHGVPSSRLLVTSWGKERPIAVGSNEQAWAQNRRSVTLIVR